MKKVFIICLVFVLIISFAVSAIVIGIMSVNDLSIEKVKSPYIVSAQENLEVLRRGTHNYSSYMYNLKYNIKEGNLSLADIDTNEEELEKLLIKGYIANAEFFLSSLRDGSSNYESCFHVLNRELKDGNLSLADIGTNDKELEELRIKGCKVSAEEYLSFLRDGTSQYEYWVKRTREELKKGNLSLADIDTSEEELRSLAPKPKLDPKKMAQTPWFLQQGVFCWL